MKYNLATTTMCSTNYYLIICLLSCSFFLGGSLVAEAGWLGGADEGSWDYDNTYHYTTNTSKGVATVSVGHGGLVSYTYNNNGGGGGGSAPQGSSCKVGWHDGYVKRSLCCYNTRGGEHTVSRAICQPLAKPSPPPAPSANLTVQNTTSNPGVWTGSNITIQPTDEIALNWTSNSHTSYCTGDSKYSTNNAKSGPQTVVTEPDPGSAWTYKVTCYGNGQNRPDTLKVTTVAWDPVVIDIDTKYVHSGDTVDITWTVGNNTEDLCTLDGPGVSGALSSLTNPYTATITGESDFTITCPGGTDTATVRVLPTIEET